MNVKKNYFYNLSYQILALILPLITTPYIARIFGKQGTGAYTYTNTIANYFLLFAMLGITTYGNRCIAQERENQARRNEVFNEIFGLQFRVASLFSAVYLFYVFFINKTYYIIAIIQTLYVISAIFDVTWLYYGLGKFKITSIRNTLIKLLTVISIFLFVKTKDDLWIYTIIKSGGVLLGQISLWISIRKYVRLKWINFNRIKKHLTPILILFVPVVATSIFQQMDKIMLGKLASFSDVGLYYNSQLILDIPQCVVTSMGTVMLPFFSNLYAKGKDKQNKEYLRKTVYVIMFLAVATTVGIASIAPELAPVFLGEEFNECSTIILLLSPHVLLASWNNTIRMQYLVPTMQDKLYINSVLYGAIVNFLINWLLIGKIGIYGAILGTIFAELAVALYQTWKVRKEIDIGRYIIGMLPFLAISLVMYIVIRAIGTCFGVHITTIIIEVFLGGVIYIGLSVMFWIVSKNDIFYFELNKLKEKIKNRREK